MLALLAVGARVRVVSPDRFAVPRAVLGRPIRPPVWLDPPVAPQRLILGKRNLKDVAVTAARNVMAAVEAPVKARRLAAAARSEPPAAVLHNGFPAPGARIFDLVDPEARAPRVMLVHSPPQAVASFAAHQPGLSVEGLARQMARYEALVTSRRRCATPGSVIFPNAPG
ncbi:MAG: hypothetical protein P8Y13_16980 [Deinococcales bacterium]